ncbi:MAG: hypothetical protein ACYSWQ_08690 [Planctomycetota bacterium]|jgi:hypothetical protein
MKVENSRNIVKNPVEVDGAKDAEMRLLISEADGAQNFAMRMFELRRWGAKLCHAHV